MTEPTPITPPPGARTATPSQSTLQRWGRQSALIEQATLHARADGERAGYAKGWRWGLIIGATAGVLATAAAWAAWHTATAPDAPPASGTAARPLT